MHSNHRSNRIPGESLVPKDPTFPPNGIFPHLTLSPAGTSLSLNHWLRNLCRAKPDRHSAPIRASYRPASTVCRCWTTHKRAPSPSSQPQPILFTPRHRGDGPRSLRDEKSKSRERSVILTRMDAPNLTIYSPDAEGFITKIETRDE